MTTSPELRPASELAVHDVLSSRDPRADAFRTVTYLMLFRVAVATLQLLSIVGVALSLEDTWGYLSGPFGHFVFALLATVYIATLAYAVAMRRIQHPVVFGYIQIGVDLILITLLVHATGGAQSAYTFLYLIDVVLVVLLPGRLAVVTCAGACASLMLAISLAGYWRWIPPLPGQTVLPWDMTQEELLFRSLIFLAGVASVGALGMNLSTQSRRARERLVRHQEIASDLALLHDDTIRCLSSGLATVELDGTITSINQAACDMLGITASRAVGQPLGEGMPALRYLLENPGQDSAVRRQEVTVQRRDRVVFQLGVSVAPLTDHAGNVRGRVIHMEDLTELRRMEIQVQRAQRLASIGRLSAAIAHEIRNPLASISGSVEVLKTLPGTVPETRQLTDIVVREVDHLNSLITSMLEYARPQLEEHKPVDVSEVVREVASAFKQESRDVELQVGVVARGLAVIGGAQSQLRQVVWNLVRNAAEAMTEKGQIHVTVSDREVDGQRQVVVSVADNGPGIPKKNLDHVFEPFFSTKPKGTGLGLATVARIVEDHRGTIDIASEPNQGTTVTMQFPAHTG
jgi:two-component system sensor histidine kinase PilS (NtrC family)